MKWFLLVAAVSLTLGAGRLAPASRDAHGESDVTKLSARDVVETLDGKAARVTTIEVAFEPGDSGRAHRHAGPVFGYVLEGEYELGIGKEPAQTLKAGDTFYEPGGVLHRVSRNPSDKNRARVLAVILHPRDVEQITIPAGED